MRSGRTIRLWRDELGKQPPYRTDRPGAVRQLRRQRRNAPATCRWAGRCRPNVLDLNPVFRNLTNGRLDTRRQGADRRCCATTDSTPSIPSARTPCDSGSCRAGRSRRKSREQILKYCMSDVDALVRVCCREFCRTLSCDTRRRALSRRIRRRVCRDGAPRRSDRHGNFPAARRQGRLARGARRDGSGDRREVRRLCPAQQQFRLDLLRRDVDRLPQARGHLRCLAAAGVRRARYAAQNLRRHDKRVSAA